MSGGKCAVCGATAGQQCAGCKVVYYCGREHQRAHWPKHRSECRPVTLTEDIQLGRYLIASRNIAAGELVLKENPTILEKLYTQEEDGEQGPKYVSRPICLGCLKAAKVDCPCSGCGWPLCSSECETSSQHRAECTLMRSKGFRADISSEDRRFPDYVCIAPLRVLQLPEEKRRKVLELQSHLEARKKTPIYNVLKNNVVAFLRQMLGFAEQYTEDEILEICAILDTNAFEVQPHGGLKVRGLYLLAAMMAHDCKPNTRHAFDDSNTLYVYATVDIKKGENVTTTYTNTFWSTTMRHIHLQNAKCFDCTCARCSDPTEFGTFVGAIVCSKCNQGKVISTEPLKIQAPWKCNSCGNEISAKQIDWGNQALREEVDKLDKRGPKDLEDFLEKYKNILHPTNGHSLQAKHALSKIYGNAEGYQLSDLNEAQLERKLEITHELLDEILGDAMGMLQEATQILRNEPGMEGVLQERLATLASQLDIVLESEPLPTEPKSRLAKPPATAVQEN
ncbi:hypothetical protein B566_EDAN007589 [Ephemera danica]|nr:hypothetical protein B566_EDAN007589 [Ephemera danica]